MQQRSVQKQPGAQRPAANSPRRARNENELVRAAQQGCTDSFAELVRQNSPRLLRFLYRRTGCMADAEDLTQEAFIRAYRNLGRYEKAAAQYKRYDYLVDEGLIPVDSVSFVPILNREYNNLLFLHAPALVSVENRASLYVEEEDFKVTRVVFE